MNAKKNYRAHVGDLIAFFHSYTRARTLLWHATLLINIFSTFVNEKKSPSRFLIRRFKCICNNVPSHSFNTLILCPFELFHAKHPVFFRFLSIVYEMNVLDHSLFSFVFAVIDYALADQHFIYSFQVETS